MMYPAVGERRRGDLEEPSYTNLRYSTEHRHLTPPHSTLQFEPQHCGTIAAGVLARSRTPDTEATLTPSALGLAGRLTPPIVARPGGGCPCGSGVSSGLCRCCRSSSCFFTSRYLQSERDLSIAGMYSTTHSRQRLTRTVGLSARTP